MRVYDGIFLSCVLFQESYRPFSKLILKDALVESEKSEKDDDAGATKPPHNPVIHPDVIAKSTSFPVLLSV